MVSPSSLESQRTPAEAFRDAVGIIGGQSATSRLIGLSQQAISDRLSKGLNCPAENGTVLKIEAATGILRHELRPDIYPVEAAATAGQATAADASMEPAR